MTTSQITLPAPRTWSPQDKVFVPELRADVSDAVALLTQRPYLVAQSTTGMSIPSATATPVTLDSELTDTWNGHLAPPSATTSQYWAPLAGWYVTDIRLPWTYSGAAAMFYSGVQMLSNGISVGASWGPLAVNGSGSGLTARCVDLLPMHVAGAAGGTGDYIQPLARQDSGSAVSLNNSAVNLPTASIRWACALSGTASLAVPPLASVPTPITSAWLNSNVRDTVNFLVYPPALKAHYVAGSSTLANSTLTTPQVVPLSTADLDTYSGLTTGASAKYTIPVSGRYLVAGQVSLAVSSTATFYACGVYVNSTTLYWGSVVRFAGSSIAGGAGIIRRLRFNAGDTVQLVGAQGSGGAVAYSTAASSQTRLILVWEGI